jgi:hypothetical protein
MSDSNQSDHWDFLASILGAEPQKQQSGEEPIAAAEVKIPEVAEDTDVQKVVSQPFTEPPPAPPAQPTSNWDALAMELGVEIKSEPPKPPAPVHPPIAKKPETKVVAQARQPREFGATAREETGKQVDHFKPAKPMPSVESTESDEKKSRHNRRHRHKSSDKDRSVGEIKRPAVDSGLETPGDEDLIDISLELAEKNDVGNEPGTSEDKAEQRPKKSRRSRRGSRSKKQTGREVAQEKHVHPDKRAFAGQAEPIAENTSSQKFHDEEDIADEEHEEGAEREAKSGFRSLPTWEEAVGCIIAKNIEAHPKRQGSGSGRSRSAESHKRGRR